MEAEDSSATQAQTAETQVQTAEEKRSVQRINIKALRRNDGTTEMSGDIGDMPGFTKKNLADKNLSNKSGLKKLF